MIKGSKLGLRLEPKLWVSSLGLAALLTLLLGVACGGGESRREQIAFISIRDAGYDIYVINLDGSGEINLTNHPADDWRPAWSPDGRRIAFVSDRDGNWEIYVMNADGSDVRRLTTNEGRDTHPTRSPDGRRIAFQSEREKSTSIYVMDSDGSNVTRLTSPTGQTEPDYTLAAGESVRDLFILERQWEGSLVARNSAGEIIFELELAWEELEELEQIVIR